MYDPKALVEIMPSLCGGLGMVVLNWSFVENNLDHWTAIAYADFGGSSIEAELPRQFGRKVKFLRKCFRRIPELSTFQDECTTYIDRAEAISTTRHYLVHGVLKGFDPENYESFTFAKIDVSEDKNDHVVGELTIPGAKLLAVGLELLDMIGKGQSLSTRLIKAAEAKY